MISYEIPFVMSVLGVILLSGSLNLNDIVAAQGNTAGYIVLQPVAFIVFFIASVAELNRTPFDLPESENELVAGYHVEYSGFRWAFFMLAEYVYLFAMSALITVVFSLEAGLAICFPWLYSRCRLVRRLKFSTVVFVYIWLRAYVAAFPCRQNNGIRLESPPANRTRKHLLNRVNQIVIFSF